MLTLRLTLQYASERGSVMPFCFFFPTHLPSPHFGVSVFVLGFCAVLALVGCLG